MSNSRNTMYNSRPFDTGKSLEKPRRADFLSERDDKLLNLDSGKLKSNFTKKVDDYILSLSLALTLLASLTGVIFFHYENWENYNGIGGLFFFIFASLGMLFSYGYCSYFVFAFSIAIIGFLITLIAELVFKHRKRQFASEIKLAKKNEGLYQNAIEVYWRAKVKDKVSIFEKYLEEAQQIKDNRLWKQPIKNRLGALNEYQAIILKLKEVLSSVEGIELNYLRSGVNISCLSQHQHYLRKRQLDAQLTQEKQNGITTSQVRESQKLDGNFSASLPTILKKKDEAKDPQYQLPNLTNSPTSDPYKVDKEINTPISTEPTCSQHKENHSNKAIEINRVIAELDHLKVAHNIKSKSSDPASSLAIFREYNQKILKVRKLLDSSEGPKALIKEHMDIESFLQHEKYCQNVLRIANKVLKTKEANEKSSSAKLITNTSEKNLSNSTTDSLSGLEKLSKDTLDDSEKSKEQSIPIFQFSSQQKHLEETKQIEIPLFKDLPSSEISSNSPNAIKNFEHTEPQPSLSYGDDKINDNPETVDKPEETILGEILPIEVAEGNRQLRSHQVRERNTSIVKAKRAQCLAQGKEIECEACGFNFKEAYGERGKNYSECHHTKPLHKMREGEKTKLEDLVFLCANCHRIVHRYNPMLSMRQLKKLISSPQS